MHLSFLEGDLPAQVHLNQRLIHRLHLVLPLADLHLGVDLVDLILSDEIPDRRGGNQNFQRQSPPPADFG